MFVDDKISYNAKKGDGHLNIATISEDTFMIYYDAIIDPDNYRKVAQTKRYIEQQQHANIIELIPSYRGLMVQYDWKRSNAKQLISELNLTEENIMSISDSLQSKTVHIPVCYGGEFGPDIETVMEVNQQTEHDVINIHTAQSYLIYMIGFMPGFPFLGGLDERLATPRRSEPRLSIPAGSVGIANNQTGIYPSASPGGWQIIGRTPIKIFDAQRTPMMYYAAGDKIQFYEITSETFTQIQQQQQEGTLDVEKWVKITYDD